MSGTVPHDIIATIDAALAGTAETFVTLPAVDFTVPDAFRQALDDFAPVDTPAGREAARWLREFALSEHLTSRTTVLLGNGRILGYYSLASAYVDMTPEARATVGVVADRKRVPATLMTWIARDPTAEMTGGDMLLHAAARARRVHEFQATAVMVLEAYDETTAAMWLSRPYPLHRLDGRKVRLVMGLQVA